jgi:hypothetical protein
MFGFVVIILTQRAFSLLRRRWLFLVEVKPKLLHCLFWLDVLCSYVKTEQFGVMDRCMRCPHYLRFLRVMAEEDEKVWDEIDRMREFELDDG